MNLENWQSPDPGLCYKRTLRFLNLNQKWDSHAREILMSNLLHLASHGYDEAESIYGLCVLTGLLEPIDEVLYRKALDILHWLKPYPTEREIQGLYRKLTKYVISHNNNTKSGLSSHNAEMASSVILEALLEQEEVESSHVENNDNNKRFK